MAPPLRGIGSEENSWLSPRKDDHLVDSVNDDEPRDTEQEHVRSSNDEEQERSGTDVPHDRDDVKPSAREPWRTSTRTARSPTSTVMTGALSNVAFFLRLGPGPRARLLEDEGRAEASRLIRTTITRASRPGQDRDSGLRA